MDWPPIVQGAIGSAVFWLVLVVTQKAVEKSITRFGKLEGVRKKEGLHRELIQEKMMRQHLQLAMTVCQYQALSYMARAAIFLGFGVILATVEPVFLGAGGIGFLYYLYRGFRWLKPFTVESDKSNPEIWERIREIETQLLGAAKEDTLATLEALRSKPKEG